MEALYIILSGRLALFVDHGAGPNKVIEWRAGDVTGMLPYSRLVTPLGDSSALEPLEILAIPRDHLTAMTRECFDVTSILVHTMIDRARLFTSVDLQNEKMISLGKLSAGLAHELNNPASAIERCAAMLEDRIEDSEEATRGLAAATLSDEARNQLGRYICRSDSFVTNDHLRSNLKLDCEFHSESSWHDSFDAVVRQEIVVIVWTVHSRIASSKWQKLPFCLTCIFGES